MENLKLIMNAAGELPEATALSTAGVAVDYTGKEDGRILLLLEGTGTVTVAAGTGIQGTEDLTATVTAAAALVLESGKYMQMEGENRGKVVLKGTGVTVRAIELP